MPVVMAAVNFIVTIQMTPNQPNTTTHIFPRLFSAQHHQHLRHHPLVPLAEVEAVKAVAVHGVEDVEPA